METKRSKLETLLAERRELVSPHTYPANKLIGKRQPRSSVSLFISYMVSCFVISYNRHLYE